MVTRSAAQSSTKLVFVEGFPGSGKSATAQWITIQLERQGCAARWFYEYHEHHPVSDTRPDAFAHFSTWYDFARERLERWRSFVAAASVRDEVTVFDSGLLQNVVLTVLRRMVDLPAIVKFVQEAGDLIHPLAPRLVYFSQLQPEAVYQAMCTRRGPAYTDSVVERYNASPYAQQRNRGLEGLLAYWREHKEVTDHAVATLSLPTLILDSSTDNWSTRRTAIAEFLGFRLLELMGSRGAELARFVGRYPVTWRGQAPLDWARIYSRTASAECTVRLKNDDLVLDGVLWPENRLIPKARNVFYAESWPLEVIFETSSDGTIRAVTIQG
jgi:hypothetical protein